jgi:CRP-like cAMP-binding protein
MREEGTEVSRIKRVIESFHPPKDHEWQEFAGKLFIKKFKKGDYLTSQGQVENHIYFLNTGSTRSWFLQEGNEYTVDFHFDGDFATAYLSFITREPSLISIEALEDTEAYVISHRSLNELYVKHHSIEKIGRLIAEYQYAKRLRKEMDLLSKTAEERYGALFERNPALIQNTSVKHLSSYLGIQPESLSRIRKLHRQN